MCLTAFHFILGQLLFGWHGHTCTSSRSTHNPGSFHAVAIWPLGDSNTDYWRRTRGVLAYTRSYGEARRGEAQMKKRWRETGREGEREKERE